MIMVVVIATVKLKLTKQCKTKNKEKINKIMSYFYNVINKSNMPLNPSD